MKAEHEKDDGKVELPPAILVRVDAIDQYESRTALTYGISRFGTA